MESRPIQQQLMALQSQMLQLRRSIESLVDASTNNHIQSVRERQRITTNVNRLAMTPGRRLRHVGAGGAAAGQPNGPAAGQPNVPAAGVAALSPNPRCLYTIWREYTEGIGGRKPARLFSAEERGRAKHIYTRRKAFWDMVDRMVRRGLIANVAIDRIYTHYGRYLSVTRVLNRIRQDRRMNMIPAALA